MKRFFCAGLRSLGAVGGLLLFYRISLSFCLAQDLVSIQASRVVDVRGLVQARTGRNDFLISNVAQNHGRWATVVHFLDRRESRIVTGGEQGSVKLSGSISGSVQRVALDPAGDVHLRVRSNTRPFVETMEVWDPELRLTERYNFKGQASLEPVLTSTGVYWIEGTVGMSILNSSLQTAGRMMEWMPEFRLVFGLPTPSGRPRWVRLNDLAEEVAVFKNDGELIANSTLDLGSAYRAANLQVGERDLITGIHRVSFAGISQGGNLYVCLSSVPVGRPTPIAILDPMNGRLVKVLSLTLPATVERRDRYNPDGYMIAVEGAIDDQLAILDTELGLLALYPIE